MRVVCINDKWVPDPGCEAAERPVFLCEYLVLYSRTIQNKEYYALVGFNEAWIYEAAFFATLPDAPAEVIEEEELQTA
jgi:hypothetical protein